MHMKLIFSMFKTRKLTEIMMVNEELQLNNNTLIPS